VRSFGPGFAVRAARAAQSPQEPPGPAKVAVIASACPTGVTAFLVAGRFRTGEALASNAITLSTIAGVVTVAFWLHVLEWF